VYEGVSFGSAANAIGEVVFNTSMTGYQEILTDPSYRGQIVVMTAPEIGNVGTNTLDFESIAPQVEGYVVRELSPSTSSWRSTQALHDHLREHRIPGVAEIDTRALTRHLRSRGVMKGVLSSVDRSVESLVRKAREAPGLETQDLVRAVSCRAPFTWSDARDARWAPSMSAPEGPRLRCVAYDFGAKRNIFRLLHDSGFDVTVVPAATSSADTLALDPDAIFLSNGPGDPETATYAIEAVRGLVGKRPMFGICLGHQIAALAVGATTFKLKFGHRGANHPVKFLETGKVEITSQNHGFAVDVDSMQGRAVLSHVSLNDKTVEGMRHGELPVFGVQYHPEASPGPNDANYLFDRFCTLMQERQRR
jgi:carbamoyl-phosphate synthase small subunit